jgi:fermentation-respiration switch protein FrsA (DUF1100 family)
MGSMLIYLGVGLAVVYLGWGAVLYLMQARFLYRPVREVVYTPDELDMDFEDVVFKADDGVELSGWYVPAEDSNYTVLFCHGNGGNIMHRLDSINFFHNLGLSCFIFDYRGYGKSKGRPSEEGTYLDVQAAYQWLIESKKMRANKIIVFGRSLGGSIAAHLARKAAPRGLVLESSFTSYADMGKRFYPYMPVRWFARFGYRTIDYVKDVRCPVLVIHSRDDEIVCFDFGLELYEAAKEPKEFVEISGSHNDGFLICGEIYREAWTRWLKFLADYEARPDQQQAT